MKEVGEVRSKLFAILAELEFGVEDKHRRTILKVRLDTLNDILDDEDIPEEFWDRIEEQTSLYQD